MVAISCLSILSSFIKAGKMWRQTWQGNTFIWVNTSYGKKVAGITCALLTYMSVTMVWFVLLAGSVYFFIKLSFSKPPQNQQIDS